MAKNTKRTVAKKKTKPTLMTALTIAKLETVFGYCGTDEEACLYAGIAPRTLYNYQKNHPEFVQRKALLKKKLQLKARETVAKDLDDPKTAMWYLERKCKTEFSTRQEIGGEDGQPIQFVTFTAAIEKYQKANEIVKKSHAEHQPSDNTTDLYIE